MSSEASMEKFATRYLQSPRFQFCAPLMFMEVFDARDSCWGVHLACYLW